MLMIYVKNNPFQRATTSTVDFEGRTLREIVTPWMTNGEFQYPTVVRVNGVPWLRANWDSHVEDNSTVEIAVVVGATLATVLIVANVVSLIATVAFTAYGIYKARKAMRALSAGVGQYDADAFFSVDGHGNKANLNGPVEVAYGKNRIWPSYIARPYNTFVDDANWGHPFSGERPPGAVSLFKSTRLAQIFCIGQGDFDVHAIQVGDLPLESYHGMRCEIVRPGQSTTTLSRIMYVPPDFEPVELLIGNSTVIYATAPPGVTTNRFEIDVESSVNGTYYLNVYLYEVDADGVIDPLTVTTVPLQRPYRTSEANAPPHRNTFAFIGGSSSKRHSMQIGYPSHDGVSGVVTVLQIRSFVDPATPVAYADKTLLLVDYYVTSFEDTLAKDTVNVIATRRLKTIHEDYSGRIEITQPTRSIPWAIYDALTNRVYGGGLSETFIDVASFARLDGELERDGIFFDYVFNQGTTVEDAVKVIAAAGRCSLTYNGSKLALIRESCNPIPEAMFTTENIVDGSFSWGSELFDPTEPDGIEVGYVEPESGQLNTIVFTPEGSTLNSIQKLSPQGIGSRTQAWREAAFRMRKLQFVRDSFKFKTGLEGYIPTIGSVAALSQDLTSMGTSGYVENYENGYLYLSKEILLNTTGDVRGRILLRADDGSAMGPFDITSFVAGSAANMSQNVYIGDVGFDIYFWRVDREPSHFIAWAGSGDAPVATKIRIENVVPSDDNTVEITATNYDPRVYEFDAMSPPAIEDEGTPVSPGVGAISVPWVRVKKVTTHTDGEGRKYVRIWWGRNYGATSYKVYKDSVLVWSGTDTYADIPMVAWFNILVGVSAMNGAIESPTTDVVFDLTGLALSNPTVNPTVVLEPDGIRFEWDAVPIAEGYEVRALVAGTYSPWYPCEATSFTFTKTMFAATYGKPVSSVDLGITLWVRAIENGLAGPSSGVSTTIPAPSAPSSLTISLDSPVVVGNSQTRARTFTWEGSDFCTFKIYTEAYYTGTPWDGTFAPKPWLLFADTDKKHFSSNKSIPQVQLSEQPLTLLSARIDPIYGPGYDCKVGTGSAMLINPDTRVDNGVWVYQSGDIDGGKFHTFIKNPPSQSDDQIWIGRLDLTEFPTPYATVITPFESSAIPPPPYAWRCEGAIVADNGWFDSSAVSITPFDIVA